MSLKFRGLLLVATWNLSGGFWGHFGFVCLFFGGGELFGVFCLGFGGGFFDGKFGVFLILFL